jgi:hypothetical protein
VTPSPEQKKQHTQPQPEKKKEPPADKLVSHLRKGYWGSKAKGWHSKELNMMDPNRRQINYVEKTQFLHEVALLEQLLSDPRHYNNHALKFKRSQKFKKRQSGLGGVPTHISVTSERRRRSLPVRLLQRQKKKLICCLVLCLCHMNRSNL